MTLFEQFLSHMDDDKPSSANRNNNACTADQDTPPPQLYPHIRKIYNSDTCLLEYARVIMSTIKPDDEVGRQCRARVSKQRAKVLISGYCTRGKIPENVKLSTNKRIHSSLCLSSLR